MAKVAILVAKGSEEMETISVVDVLRRARIEVSIASEDGQAIKGSQQTSFLADCSYDDVLKNEYDVIVLPGGYPGTTNLAENEKVKQILKKQNDKNAYLAAICAAPLALDAAGVLLDKNYTCYPGTEEKIKNGNYVGGKVCVDGNIITGEGPSRSIVFALCIIENICGKEKLQEILKNLLLKECDYYGK